MAHPAGRLGPGDGLEFRPVIGTVGQPAGRAPLQPEPVEEADQSVPSDLSDYQITANPGSRNPWRTGRVTRHDTFTVHLRPRVTAAQQRAGNAIPMIDQNPPANPSGPARLGYVIFRTYIPAGGNTTVRLPSITIRRNGRSTTLPPCPRDGTAAGRRNAALSRMPQPAGTLGRGTAAVPELQYFGPSAASQSGLFPNAVNAYLVMEFTPKQGYVIVTHGQAPTSPTQAGHGVPRNSVGAYPVPWIHPDFQVRYWSIANYLNTQPYPVVKIGRGSRAIFGGTADYLTSLRNGFYTVVSSLPADKPSAAALKAYAATWIPTSAAHPTAPEFQLLRNMLSQQALYPEGFTFIPPPPALQTPFRRPACSGTWGPTIRKQLSARSRRSTGAAGQPAWPPPSELVSRPLRLTAGPAHV
jgi:hypothetical protein